MANHLKYGTDGHLLRSTAGHLINGCGCHTTGDDCPAGLLDTYTLTFPATIDWTALGSTPSACGTGDTTSVTLNRDYIGSTAQCGWEFNAGAGSFICVCGYEFNDVGVGLTAVGFLVNCEGVAPACDGYGLTLNFTDGFHLFQVLFQKPRVGTPDGPVGTYEPYGLLYDGFLCYDDVGTTDVIVIS